MGDRGIGGAARLRPNSFGSALLSASLVDAVIGDQLRDDPASREAVKGTGFFLPAIYRGVMGNRVLGLTAKRPWLAGAGRYAAGAATAGFVADLGVMGYHHLSEGEAQITREHRLYQRAGEIAQLRQGWFSKLWRGALGIFMPSVAERAVPEEFVESARGEMKDHAQGLASSTAQALRHHLIFGHGGEDRSVEFYRKLDWDFLRGENELGVIKRGEDKPDWYLEVVAEDLADPVIRYRYLENKNVEQQINFIQNRYRWDLSPGDVREILGRIALHHARQGLADIHGYITREENVWAKLFDASGRLNPGQEKNLTTQLFASLGEVPSGKQILALRKVGLLVRIRQLREVLTEVTGRSKDPWTDLGVIRAELDLKDYEVIAKKMGVMDSEGNFAAGEITDQAMRIPVAQAILEENASGLL
jgi:hypothetical protein